MTATAIVPSSRVPGILAALGKGTDFAAYAYAGNALHVYDPAVSQAALDAAMAGTTLRQLQLAPIAKASHRAAIRRKADALEAAGDALGALKLRVSLLEGT